MSIVRDCRQVFWDIRGIEIRPGDLVKSFHFKSGRRNHYLYHTVVAETHQGKVYFYMVPTSHLEPTNKKDGGKCLLMPDLAASVEVIHGIETLGKREHLVSWTDRRKFKLVEEGLEL